MMKSQPLEIKNFFVEEGGWNGVTSVLEGGHEPSKILPFFNKRKNKILNLRVDN